MKSTDKNNKGSKSKTEGTPDADEDAEEEIEETISKAADMGEKIGGIREKKPVSPESALPPSSAVFLKEGDEANSTHEPVPGGVDPERESKIVEKSSVPEKAGPTRQHDIEPDPDLIEHHKDFSRRPREMPPPRKRPEQTKEKPQPAVRESKPPPSRPSPRPRTPPPQREETGPPTTGKFQPAVAGVADTNLKKCPQCGGFVNLAVSSTCFNCGYDIK